MSSIKVLLTCSRHFLGAGFTERSQLAIGDVPTPPTKPDSEPLMDTEMMGRMQPAPSHMDSGPLRRGGKGAVDVDQSRAVGGPEGLLSGFSRRPKALETPPLAVHERVPGGERSEGSIVAGGRGGGGGGGGGGPPLFFSTSSAEANCFSTDKLSIVDRSNLRRTRYVLLSCNNTRLLPLSGTRCSFAASPANSSATIFPNTRFRNALPSTMSWAEQ